MCVNYMLSRCVCITIIFITTGASGQQCLISNKLFKYQIIVIISRLGSKNNLYRAPAFFQQCLDCATSLPTWIQL